MLPVNPAFRSHVAVIDQIMRDYFNGFAEVKQIEVIDLEDGIEKVIFNDPATIVIFKDGTKIVVKTTDGDEFQPEIGFAMAMMKAVFGSRGSYKKWIKQWLPQGEEDDYDFAVKPFISPSMEDIGKETQLSLPRGKRA